MPPKLPSILIGAAFYLVVGLILQFAVQPSSSPAAGLIAGALGCVVMLGSAVLAVWHYTSTHRLTVPAGAGAGMGALALLVGVLASLVVSYALVAAGVLPDPQVVAEQQMRAQGLSREEIEAASRFANPVLGGAIALVIGAVAGAAGGALGASLFKAGPREDVA